MLQQAGSRGASKGDLSQCVAAMHESRFSVLKSIMLPCSTPAPNAFCDPRPSLAEAWLIAAAKLQGSNGTMAMDILSDTFVAVIVLLFYPSLEKNREEREADMGMSLDGPHILALTDFLTHFLSLGDEVLRRATLVLVREVPADFEENDASVDTHRKGVAIVGAALFRAFQGGLPPWAIEATPEIYEAFYQSLNRQSFLFEEMLRLAMMIRLPFGGTKFGGIDPGDLLSGRCFHNFSIPARDRFVEDAVVLCRKDDKQSWRKLKMIIKQACGGKKKEADFQFQLKPAVNRWEFDRI